MSLHVDRHGNAGSPLLFIHGWGMHSGMWGNALNVLSERYAVSAVDLPGHGYSKADRGFGTGKESLDSVVDKLSMQFTGTLAVCGWSLGGQIALRWAERHPGQVDRLVLVSSTPCFVQKEGWRCAISAQTLADFSSALLQDYAGTLRRFLALQMRGSENEREHLSALRQSLMGRGTPDMAALQSGLGMLRDVDLRLGLPKVRKKTLVIAGERDTLTPLAASEYIAEKMPDARLSAIAGAAHAPFLSHPEEFVKRVTEFLHE